MQTDRAGCSVQELLLLPLGVTGNTSASGAEESRFDPWRGNSQRMMRPAPKGPGASLFCGSNSSELSRQRCLPKRPPVSERTCSYFLTEVHAHTDRSAKSARLGDARYAAIIRAKVRTLIPACFANRLSVSGSPRRWSIHTRVASSRRPVSAAFATAAP